MYWNNFKNNTNKYGFIHKKSLGQNFLKDLNVLRKIVSIISPLKSDKIIEIGPGQGALTKYLEKSGGYVLTIEKDIELGFYIKKNFNVDVLIMDALDVCWSKINGKFNKIVGNLPYNIATTLIWDIVANLMDVEKMVFTVQKEVAEKIGAKVGEKKYGSLSVWIQTFCDVRLEFQINPRCFYPRPKVISQVIVLTPKKIFLDKKTKTGLLKTLRVCFSSPRKQLKNLLKCYWNEKVEELFRKQKLSKNMRPNMLSCEDYLELSKAIF